MKLEHTGMHTSGKITKKEEFLHAPSGIIITSAREMACYWKRHIQIFRAITVFYFSLLRP